MPTMSAVLLQLSIYYKNETEKQRKGNVRVEMKTWFLQKGGTLSETLL